MNNHEYEHRPSFGDRLLERLSDSMNRTLQYLWHHRREDHDNEAARRLDGYGKAYKGPARRMLDTVEQRAREDGPGWREPSLPGLEGTAREQDYSRTHAQIRADEQRRRDEFEKATFDPAPVTRRERGHGSIWTDDMRDAENAALQVAATENTHDHTQGRER